MRSFRLIKVGAALLSLGAAGCGQQTAISCPRAIGTFQPSYTYINGNCEPTFEGRTLLLAKDAPESSVMKENNLADSVTTEINLIGCTIGMKQEITDTSGMKKISELSGDLNVEDTTALSGEILRTEYMPDGQAVRCSGYYNATYTLSGSGSAAPVGSAAQTALNGQ